MRLGKNFSAITCYKHQQCILIQKKGIPHGTFRKAFKSIQSFLLFFQMFILVNALKLNKKIFLALAIVQQCNESVVFDLRALSFTTELTLACIVALILDQAPVYLFLPAPHTYTIRVDTIGRDLIFLLTQCRHMIIDQQKSITFLIRTSSSYFWASEVGKNQDFQIKSINLSISKLVSN